MDDGRLGEMQPVHALRRLLRHGETAVERELARGVVEQLLKVALWHELHDDGHVARHSARSHEEKHVRVVQATTTRGLARSPLPQSERRRSLSLSLSRRVPADLDLLLEVIERLVREILAEELLDGDLLAAALALEHATEAATANLLNVRQLLRQDLSFESHESSKEGQSVSHKRVIE